jgi:uncharacterized membrane protein YiaA
MRMATAANTARQARNSSTLEVLTRGGFVGYGIMHLALAWLAIEIAVYHHSGHSADQAGAFKLIGQQPLGKVLLIVIAVGLAAMAVWQLLLAAVGHTDERDRKRDIARLASAGLAVAYGLLCFICVKTIIGAEGSNSASQRKTTSTILAHPWGRWLVAIAGLVVLGSGIGMIVYGIRTKFEKKLDFRSASPQMRRSVLWIARTGYAGKGVTFGIIGVLLMVAAFADQAHRADGLDGALHTLAAQPFGKVLLIAVAIGLVAYGLYGIAQSRYRKV